MQPPEITFRRAVAADLPSCVALMVELVREVSHESSQAGIITRLPADLGAALSSPHVAVILAEQAGVAIGLARGDILFSEPTFRLEGGGRCGYVDQMYVQPPFRDQRVGEALLGQLEAYFIAERLPAILLHAAPRAARFYARLGYAPNRQMYKRLEAT